MSFRDQNLLHFRTPYALLRIPEYMRFFDSKGIGSFYRLLSSKIYRRGTNELKFYKEGSYITELAKEYSKGNLCAYLSEEEETDSMMMGQKNIENLRKLLVELKLIKVRKFKTNGTNGHIYQLGTVISLEDEDGYQIGEEIEGHYIDQWYTYANTKDEKPEVYAAFRCYLAEKIGSADKKQSTFDEIGKIFPEIRKNFSEILGKSPPPKYSPRRQKADTSSRSIEVITKEDISSLKRTTPEDESKNEELLLRQQQFAARVKSGQYRISHISKEYKDMLGLGAEKDVLDNLILSTVHEKNRFKGLPMFSKNLEVKHKDDVERFSWLWFAMKQDVAGAIPPANKKANIFQQIHKSMSLAVKKYPAEQILWTIREVAKEPELRKSFLNSAFSIDSILHNMSVKYLKYQENKKISDAKTQSQEASGLVDTQARERFLREAASSVETEAPALVNTNTIEFWENKKKGTSNLALLQLYQSKIEALQRS